MMWLSKKMLLGWVLGAVVVLSAVCGTTEPAMSPIISPVINGNRYGTPVAAPSREIPSHLPPADNSHFGGSSLEISPAQYEVRNSSYTTHTPPNSGVSPVISPAPNELKNPSNTTHAPSTSKPGSSAAISPVSLEPNNPSNTAPVPSTPYPRLSPMVSPAPDEVENHSTTTLAPPPSHPRLSPMISPAPHEINNSSNSFSAPVMSHPGYSPVMSPAAHEIEKPSNSTHTPSTSHPNPSPVLSPAPGKYFSNDTHAPVTSQPGSYAVISPVPSNMTHEFRNPSNQTGAHSASQHSLPPVISPAPDRNSSNISHAPVISNPGSYPVISPVPPEVKNLSNTIPAPLASHPSPAPMITPAPHEITSPLNITPAPLTSKHNSSPRNRSNSAHAPLTSHPSPAPIISPKPHNDNNPPIASHSQPPDISTLHSPASPPTTSTHHRTTKRRVGTPAAAPFSVISPSSYPGEGPVISSAPLHPPVLPKGRRRHHEPPLPTQGPFVSPAQAPFPSTIGSPAPSPSSWIPSRPDKRPTYSPVLSPSGSSSRKPRVPLPSPEWALPSPPSHLGPIHSPVHSPFSRKPRAPSPQPVWRLPSPPPNSDCNSLTCSEPLANSPPGSPCACVLPIKVGLRLTVALYTFFPLVSELAREIAAGIFMKQSQVRIMGANAATEEPEKTIVLIDLVPLGRYFDNTTANLVYIKFWHKQVIIDASLFGDYDVIYVKYPGLPASPPTAPSDINVDDGAYSSGNNGRTIRPLGVDVRKHEKKVSGSLIAIVVLSSVIGLVFVMGATWLLMLKYRDRDHPPAPTSQTLLPTLAKTSGTRLTVLGSGPSSTSASFSSSIATYTGSAKTFTLAEIERATNRFDDSRIIGEGGFGRVYQGTLEDGTRMAVKVLKRDDQQGGREFLAEVEMLSRLHHRNLVKLIGICTEDTRCLVYELIPNGSVESHLHGMDKEIAPLDWGARVKIALGAARGLAYLHEDSSPRVIHRDFKSSNILLEHDFTPKVSDFGLARTAMDGGNEQISTRVMGTFGYVAPEYAMTGHLLVKSDVYSYGVVLLELLSGRKPVDMSQPPGQENLVTWARPLLTSMDGLETIIDPALGADVPFDSVAKVAAIASMCVQPEVSHRPFMGEVVQALKLVCNESDEYRPSVSCSQEELSAHETDIRISTGFGLEAQKGLSTSDIFSTSARFTRETSGSFRRHSSSGPLRTSRSRPFWQRIRGPSSGSVSEHGVALRYVTGLEDREQWS